jgi:hypothetical protein
MGLDVNVYSHWPVFESFWKTIDVQVTSTVEELVGTARHDCVGSRLSAVAMQRGVPGKGESKVMVATFVVEL